MSEMQISRRPGAQRPTSCQHHAPGLSHHHGVLDAHAETLALPHTLRLFIRHVDALFLALVPIVIIFLFLLFHHGKGKGKGKKV